MFDRSIKNLRVAVLIPCLNEEKTVGGVVRDFKRVLPHATVYVYDNMSTDMTVENAMEAGAVVRFENHRGKGNVVRRMFHDVDADVYVLVDGDGTYVADDISILLEPVMRGTADMVVGNRLSGKTRKNISFLHRFGNRFIVQVLNTLFGSEFEDIESGFRVMNRRLVNDVPLLYPEFEVEPELTILALERGYITKEVPISYGVRPAGSHSKLATFRDGFAVLLTIVSVLRDYRPMTFFSFLGGVFLLFGLGIGFFPIIEFFQTGIVSRLPSAVLAVGLVLISVSLFLTGLLISTVNRRFRELDEIIKKRVR